MSKGSFRAALLDADRALAAMPMPAARRRAPRRIRWFVPALALASVAVIAGAIVFRSDEPRAPVATQVAGFELDAPTTAWRAHGNELEIVAPAIAVRAPGFGRMIANRGARLTRIEHGVHVLAGVVEFDVTHRAAGEHAAIVRVSHGTIAVLGTRFVVDQREAGGVVQLHEGSIRFDAPERVVTLRPGDVLAWPLVAVSEPPAPPAPAPVRTAVAKPRAVQIAPPPPAPEPPPIEEPAAASGNAILAEVASLRSRRKFDDAAKRLETALAEPLPPATLERLSYELGAIEAYHLARTDRACRHWQSHRERYPQGRYTVEIEAGMQRLGCKEETP